MGALSDIVRQGKALYVAFQLPGRRGVQLLKGANGTPCLIHQPRYNMFERWVEDGLLGVLDRGGVGCICFSPLAQGALTGRYLNGIRRVPGRQGGHHHRRAVSDGGQAGKDPGVKRDRGGPGQSLAQMALCWVLRRKEVTSVLIGASSTAQLEDNVMSLNRMEFTADELQAIENILK